MAVVRASAPVGNAGRADEGSTNHDDDRAYGVDQYANEHTYGVGSGGSPVTMGGNIRFSTRAGTKDMNISRNA